MTNYLINMKIILTTSLFFCLSITTILAAVVTTNIAAPVAGLSTNSVTDFDVNSDGTILNNSAASGTATLGSTAVTGNGNITTGSEASLILFQVTGTSGSDLDGTIEVFGGEAGLIIANPNGITCDGCGFINVNRVDLVTGSGYDAGTNTFSTIAATDITVEGSTLDIANVNVLNIQTGADFINSTTIDADNLNVIAGDDFTNAGAIVADTVTIDVTNFVNDVSNTGTVSSASLNLILTDDFNISNTNFNGFNNFRNLAITSEAGVSNSDSLDLDNLTIKTGTTFSVGHNITVDNLTFTAEHFSIASGVTVNATSFTTTVEGYFNNRGVINATSFNATAGETFGNFSGAVINTASLNVTAKNFNTNTVSTIDADTVTIEVANFASNISHAGTISAASLNFILTDDFTHASDSFTGFNNFSNLTVSTDGIFTNDNTINLAGGNLTITANSFNNTGGVVISDTFALSVAGDFEHSGTITTNASNLNIGGDFSYNDSANDFVWGANDTLTVLGDANIVAADFANSGTITITDSGNFTANTFANSGGVVADAFTLSVAGAFDYIADYGTITANSYNLTVGGDFSYDDTNNDFTWGASDTLTVAGNVNIVAADFANSGNITVTNSGNFTANTFANTGTVNTATVTIEVTNFDDDITNTGTVSATSLNFILTDDFTHTSDSFNGFNFSNLAITTDGTFTNNATINPTGNLAITANDFINIGASSVTANNFALILSNNFSNSGSINVTGSGSSGSLAITAGYTAINQGSIVSGNLDVITADFFRNLTGGDINVANLNITAGGKVTNTANIDVGTLTITANNDSTRTNDTTGFYVSNRGNITATSLNIAAVDNFYNRGNITATNFNITRAKSVFFLNREINSFYAAGHTYDGGNISLDGNSSFRADAGSIENYGNIDLGSFNLDISADSFTNKAGANVTANTVNLTVNSFVQNGTVNATVNQ